MFSIENALQELNRLNKKYHVVLNKLNTTQNTTKSNEKDVGNQLLEILAKIIDDGLKYLQCTNVIFMNLMKLAKDSKKTDLIRICKIVIPVLEDAESTYTAVAKRASEKITEFHEQIGLGIGTIDAHVKNMYKTRHKPEVERELSKHTPELIQKLQNNSSIVKRGIGNMLRSASGFYFAPMKGIDTSAPVGKHAKTFLDQATILVSISDTINLAIFALKDIVNMLKGKGGNLDEVIQYIEDVLDDIQDFLKKVPKLVPKVSSLSRTA